MNGMVLPTVLEYCSTYCYSSTLNSKCAAKFFIKSHSLNHNLQPTSNKDIKLPHPIHQHWFSSYLITTLWWFLVWMEFLWRAVVYKTRVLWMQITALMTGGEKWTLKKMIKPSSRACVYVYEETTNEQLSKGRRSVDPLVVSEVHLMFLFYSFDSQLLSEKAKQFKLSSHVPADCTFTKTIYSSISKILSNSNRRFVHRCSVFSYTHLGGNLPYWIRAKYIEIKSKTQTKTLELVPHY